MSLIYIDAESLEEVQEGAPDQASKGLKPEVAGYKLNTAIFEANGSNYHVGLVRKKLGKSCYFPAECF